MLNSERKTQQNLSNNIYNVVVASTPSPPRAVFYLLVYRWAAHLNHFLGYFPYPKPVILPLVELRRSLAPCFAALPAGDKGREREGAPTRDDAPSPEPSSMARGSRKMFSS